MTKRLVKFISILVISILMFQLFLNIGLVYADTVNSTAEIGNLFTGTAKGNTTEKAVKIGQTFITIFKVVGIGVAVVMLIALAMKYMLASAGDKADIKKHAVVYIVGAVILFAATGILQIIEMFVENFEE